MKNLTLYFHWMFTIEGVDRNVRGTVAESPLQSRQAMKTGEMGYRLGPYGFVIVEVK